MACLKKLVLYGAGGMGREVIGIIEDINNHGPQYELLGFVDDIVKAESVGGYPLLGNRDWLLAHKDEVYCLCTIGSPQARKAIQESLEIEGVRFATVIARTSYYATRTIVGEGSVFYGDVKVSVDCSIGKGVYINTGCTIGHDVTIGDYSCISPGCGISGACTIGEQVNIGGHSYIVPKRKIGDCATVAAGSIVFSNVKAGTTVLGNPAKRMKALE